MQKTTMTLLFGGYSQNALWVSFTETQQGGGVNQIPATEIYLRSPN